jgi:DNA-binding NarL/FixJ family response regulator
MRTKILIIEDHDDLRLSVKTHLKSQRMRFDIAEAANGELGVSKAKRLRPQIILMDTQLPGINGLEAAKQIQDYLPDSHIIGLSMFDAETFRRRFSGRQFYDCIDKTELLNKLMPVIKKCLKRG